MSAPRDGLSLAEETELSHLRQRLQRDMNCLSDPDRSTRRRALTKLRKGLFQEAEIPEPVLRGLLTRHLGERLVGMLADPVEKCREMAAGLLLDFVEVLDDVPADTALLAKRVFAVAEVRVGALPLAEPAEEVRALLLRLCCSALAKDSARGFGCEVAGEACAVLTAALADPFPEVKRECCTLLLRLAAVCPGGIRLRLEKVLRALIVNLGHQHSKTRQMTLQALGALLLCGSDNLDKTLREIVLPRLRNMIYDRTLAVRRELARILGRLIEAGFPDTESTGSERDEAPPSSTTTTPTAGVTRAPGAGGETRAWRGAIVAVTGGATAYLIPFRAEFVSLLMTLLADEAVVVSDEAARLLAELGEIWGKSNPAAVEAKERSAVTVSPATAATAQASRTTDLPPPPAPANGSVREESRASPCPLSPPTPLPPAARALCSSLLDSMMNMTIEDAAHWTVRGRTRAVRRLCSLVRYAGDDVTPHLPRLLTSLGEASRDDEAEVRQAVEECAAAVGRAVGELSAVTDILLPVLRGEVSGESTPQRLAQALAVLRPVVSAASETSPLSMAPLVGPVCSALCGRAILETDARAEEDLWEEELEACRAVVESGFGDELRRPQIRFDLLSALLWLLAGSEARVRERGTRERRIRGGDGDDDDDDDQNFAREEVMEIASRLARENSLRDTQDLFSEHFSELLNHAVGDKHAKRMEEGGGINTGGETIEDVWDKGPNRRTSFEALLRSAPRAVGRHLGEVMPIFRDLLHDASRKAATRLSMLALLEGVVKQREVAEEALRPHAECLVREMVLPNAVWRAGLVAATVRKVAVAVLYTALRRNKIGVETVYATAEQVLPVLKTNLEDREASTRQMACLSLQMMFDMLPGALGEEPVRLMYPELLKRLDDSSDVVRRAVCATISAFLRATAPQNIRGTVLNFSVEQLLIHLDDQDEGMQRAAYAVLEVAASIDPEGVRKLATAARPSHRTPALCDRLIAHTNK